MVRARAADKSPHNSYLGEVAGGDRPGNAAKPPNSCHNPRRLWHAAGGW